MVLKCKKIHICLLVSGILLLIIGITGLAFLSTIVNYLITQKVIIFPGTSVYDQFYKPTLPILIQVYMFNLTNVDEVMKGGKPKLVEKGPYTYREVRQKWDLNWKDDIGTVIFKQNKTYFFEESLSIGPDSELFTTINFSLMTLINGLRYQPEFVSSLISKVILSQYPEEVLFVNHTVRELVWGYIDPMLHLGRQLLPSFFYEDCIGVLAGTNNTFDGTYEIITGKIDISNLGKIITFNGSDHLDFWTTSDCNKIKGTDGTLWPPFLNKSEILHTYISQLCRSLYLTYSNDSSVGSPSIATYRYQTPPEVFYNASSVPENIGYCTPDINNCLPNGLQNITICRILDHFNVPIITSNPHFLYADQQVISSIDGMHPDPQQHNSFVDIEPMSGILLRARSVFQVNFFVDPVPGFKQVGNITKMFYPVLWANESVVANDEILDLLRNQLFTPRLLANIFLWISNALAIIFLFASLIACRIGNKIGDQSSSSATPNERTPINS